MFKSTSVVLCSAILFTIAVFSTGCASHKKGLRTFDPESDSAKIRSLNSPADLAQRANAEAEPPANLTAKEYEQMGDIHLSKGDPINAFVYYEKALRKEPQNVAIHYKKGMLFLVEGMGSDAADSFKKVLEKEPDNAPAHQGLGQAFFQLKQYEKAREHLLKAASLDSTLWNSHNLLGIIYDYEKNYPSAIASYEKAIGLKPDHGLIYNNMGLSYTMAGNYERAIASFHKAVKAGYTENRVFNNLGFALFMAGRKREAFESFKKGGNEAEALNNLGSMYLSQGEHEKAQKCFEDAIVLKPAFYDQAHENLKKCQIRNLNEITPSAESKDTNTPAAPTNKEGDVLSSPAQKDTLSYRVKEGDTSFSIAQKHNMSLSDFLKLNNLTPSSPIYQDKTVLVKPQ